jgi:hypothetical protein
LTAPVGCGDLEKLARSLLALEDARTAHHIHDIDTDGAFLATAGIFDAVGEELWFPGRRRGPLGEELRTTDPKAARYLPEWLWTRIELRGKSIEMYGRPPQSSDCPTCLAVETRISARRLRSTDIQLVRRALRRRHRRQLARQLRISVPPEVRALIEPLRAVRALGGSADFQVTTLIAGE